FCTWKKPHDILSNLRLGLRLGQDPRLLITTTPRPMQALRKLREEISCVMTQAGTSANAGNLAPSFIDGLQALYGGTRLAQQELDGVLVDGAGVLFKTEDFASTRCEPPAVFERVVVAIDPPAGLNGSACGIVVAGKVREKARVANAINARTKGKEWVAYVLADRSCQGATPLEWASVAAEAAREFGAVKIVAEANQGGEMVRQTLLTAGVPCPVELVHASKGKCVRAEPVSVLYQHGRVRHCGQFRDLEDQLVAMGAESVEEAGTDRADALVWAVSALDLIANVAGAPSIRRL
ncbi:MAG: DNA-packaging protein, partial [Burkholderiales bacterium]